MSRANLASKGARVRTYAVYTDSPEVLARARVLFEENYKVSDQLILVRSGLLTTDVAKKLGLLDGDEPPTGIVLKLNDASAGYYESDLWDWLD